MMLISCARHTLKVGNRWYLRRPCATLSFQHQQLPIGSPTNQPTTHYYPIPQPTNLLIPLSQSLTPTNDHAILTSTD